MAGEELVTGHDERVSAPLASDGWAAGRIFAHQVTMPADVGAGCYQLFAGLYEPMTAERLAVSPADGASIPDNRLPLGEVCIDQN